MKQFNLERKMKTIALYNYYINEIQCLLNPCGRNRPPMIANRVLSAIPGDAQESESDRDVDRARNALYERMTKYNDLITSTWYSDMKTVYEEDVDFMINKVIKFYMIKRKLTNEENDFYKGLQGDGYQMRKR